MNFTQLYPTTNNCQPRLHLLLWPRVAETVRTQTIGKQTTFYKQNLINKIIAIVSLLYFYSIAHNSVCKSYHSYYILRNPLSHIWWTDMSNLDFDNADTVTARHRPIPHGANVYVKDSLILKLQNIQRVWRW